MFFYFPLSVEIIRLLNVQHNPGQTWPNDGHHRKQHPQRMQEICSWYICNTFQKASAKCFGTLSTVVVGADQVIS